jgi:hypothetical protein
MDVMLGQAAVQNPMRTKQIDAKQSPTGRRTTVRLAWQILYSPPCAEVIAAIATGKKNVILISHTEVEEMSP